jgi:hypothetical protein
MSQIQTTRAGIIEPYYGHGQSRSGLGPKVFGVEDFAGCIHWWYRKSDASLVAEWIAAGCYEGGDIEIEVRYARLPLIGKYFSCSSAEDFADRAAFHAALGASEQKGAAA